MRSARGITLRQLIGGIAFVTLLVGLWYAVVPNMPHGGISKTELSAIAGLKQIANAEKSWIQRDADGNGLQDAWTQDVAGLHGRTDATGAPLKLIDIDFANADNRPRTSFFGQKPGPVAKSGYRFQAIDCDETGTPYGPGSTKFAFCAVPDVYNITAIRTFIVNEEGVVYGVNTQGSAPILRWPGRDPSACTVKGVFWSVAQ